LKPQRPPRVVGIYVYQGRAYIPHKAFLDIGVFLDIDPVLVSELSIDGLVPAVMKVLEASVPRLSSPSTEETKSRTYPLLKATGARSWKALAKDGTSYTLEFLDDKINLYMSKLDSRGRWEVDSEKTKSFDLGAPLERIVEAVLSDVSTDEE
jgi:hypothetical protein